MGQGENNDDREARVNRVRRAAAPERRPGEARSAAKSARVVPNEAPASVQPPHTIAGYSAYGALPRPVVPGVPPSGAGAAAPAPGVARAPRGPTSAQPPKAAPANGARPPEVEPTPSHAAHANSPAATSQGAPGWDQSALVRPRTVTASAPTQFGSAADAWRGAVVPVVPQRDSAHQPTLQAFGPHGVGPQAFGPLVGGAAAELPKQHPAPPQIPPVEPPEARIPMVQAAGSSREDDTPLVAVHHHTLHTLLREQDDTPLAVTDVDGQLSAPYFDPPGSPGGPRAQAADEPEAPAIMFENSVPSVVVDPSLEVEARAKLGVGSRRESSPPQSSYGSGIAQVARRGPGHWAQQSTMMLQEGGPMPSAFSMVLGWLIRSSGTGLLILCGLVAIAAVVADRLLEFRRPEASAATNAPLDEGALASDAADGIEEIPGVVSSDLAASSDTLIVSEPAGAEVIHGGSVIGTTPVLVPRSVAGGVYLLRKPGFQPQVVQVKPSTPNALHVTMKGLSAGQQAH